MKTKNRRGLAEGSSQDVLGPLQDLIRQVRSGVRTKQQLVDFNEGRNPFEKKVASENGFPVRVNYDLSVESLVAQGKYDWKNDSINSKNFQTSRKGEATLNLELVHFNQVLTSEEVIAELKKRGLRPAELHELLSFGVQYPEEQRRHPIVALASVCQSWSGCRFVPYLWVVDNERRLYFDYFDDRWYENYRFLAVCES
ncbi:MAG: hypothetical protein A3B16_02790 [Candidatus Zambryskibacteria bacterium RIFCSPLOWO2_01_FULL_45_43]|uniref:Uncharacterized protein n=2 Tax=Parcubacteria group TaxID=1794811 RepID=A0A1G1ZQQ8_9BACT|nr:MAG: hypothetical protein A3H63_01190 [Candidatus Harrisonbacteria bacterium RIFCSPLOWO2_02_FULL_45_10c]OHB04923.1 MAG: hypothetical protein A3B16_02790 [Candidatus Zambryskibacteria bacterium RIFCSPLOWO2_01_FULL_45_43]